MEEALDEIALLVKLPVDSSLGDSFFTGRNHGFESAELQLFEDGVGVVAAVSEACVTGSKVDELVCDGAVMLLAGCDQDFNWPRL